MSGGHYDYQYHALDNLADDIEANFKNDGRYESDIEWNGTKEQDYLGEATPEERDVLLKEIKSLVDDLRKCALRAYDLEWFMSGDTGVESYLKNLKQR